MRRWLARVLAAGALIAGALLVDDGTDAASLRARDLHASVRCRVTSGDAGRGGACGLVFRYVDDETHHLARVEPGPGPDGGRIVLARVVGGRETVLGSAAAPADAATWHDLAVDAQGDAIEVAYGGQTVIAVHDFVPSPIGVVGRWTAESTEAEFDGPVVDVRPTSLQTLELLPLLSQAPERSR